MKRFMIVVMLIMSSFTIAGYDFVVGDGGSADLTLNGHQTLLMMGGAGRSLTLTEWSYGMIQNTSPYSDDPIGGIRELRLMGYSHVDFYDGDVLEMGLGSFSTAALYGGKIQTLSSGQIAWKNEGQPPVLVPDPHIEIFCRDWRYNASNNRITGTWGDFSTFNIKLVDYTQYGYSPTIENIKFTIIPEPLSLLLFAVGGLVVCRRK